MIWKRLTCLLFLAALLTLTVHGQITNGKLRIIMFGGHPDDCDDGGGGTAILWAKMGYAVKFVSVTNGDAGHPTMHGEELAKRRYKETQEAGKRFGVTYDVLDTHDGQLLPTLEVRNEIIKEIREWNADVVIGPRQSDYHPDHKYTGVLVQDASFMVGVPYDLPEIPALHKSIVFLFFQDAFQQPNPFRPDVAVDISEVYLQKIHGLDAEASQMYELLPWMMHVEDKVPANNADREIWLAKQKVHPITPEVRVTLEKWYGKNKAGHVQHAEAFEFCEYGYQPTDEEIKRIFPMLGK